MSLPPVEVHKRRGLAVLTQVKLVIIKTPAQYQAMTQKLLRVNGDIKAIEDKLTPKVNAAFRLHKDLVALRAEALAPWQQAKGVLSAAISTYALAQRQAEQALQAKMEAEATAQAAAQRAKDIAAAQKQGDRAAAKELKAAPLTVPPVVAPSLVPHAPVSVQERVTYEIINPDSVPREYCDPAPRKIQARIQQVGENAMIPGVRIFKKPVVAAGAI